MIVLYTPHEPALLVTYAELERYTLSQREVLVGTPGSLTKRRKSEHYFYYTRQYYDGAGTKREQYIAGPAGDPEAEEKAASIGRRIEEAANAIKSIRFVGRNGFVLADARTQATLAVLHNLGLFSAGALLVGSHAYGVLLNKLGVRAAPYATEDIDIARRGALAIPRLTLSFVEALQESGVEFVAAPGMPSTAPSKSYKQRGKSRFHLDLLVPAKGEAYSVVAVPELKAHAQAVPYLRYLLADAQPAAIIAREGVAAVQVPTPERFALHKLLVSQLRVGRGGKADKDLQQAAVLLAVLADKYPGAIEDAAAALPRSSRTRMKRACEALEMHLPSTHRRAWESLNGIWKA